MIQTGRLATISHMRSLDVNKESREVHRPATHNRIISPSFILLFLDGIQSIVTARYMPSPFHVAAVEMKGFGVRALHFTESRF
jgi:hypothetical protein